MYDTLIPGANANYAWDEPTLSRRLKVKFEALGISREYVLDDIQKQSAIHARQVGGAPGAAPSVAWLEAGPVATVYVKVYAEGHVRVLRFSNTKVDPPLPLFTPTPCPDPNAFGQSLCFFRWGSYAF